MKLLPAVGLSALIHAAVAAGIAAYAEWGVETETFATLDLSSVELSFAEEETAEAAPSAAAPEPVPPPKDPDPEPPPPVAPDPLPALPPEPSAPSLPDPEPPRPVPEAPPPEPEANAAAAPRQAKIDAPPRPKKAIRPEYPRLSRLRGEQGDVIVEIVVNERGTVDEVTVVASSGYAELDAAAVKAAKAAKFNPAKADGAAVRSTARLTLNFQLK